MRIKRPDKIVCKDGCINARLLKDPNFPLIDIVRYDDGSRYEVHLDDYGQSYFIVYTTVDGNTSEAGCGSYCTEYIETIEYLHNCYSKKMEGKVSGKKR